MNDDTTYDMKSVVIGVLFVILAVINIYGIILAITHMICGFSAVFCLIISGFALHSLAILCSDEDTAHRKAIEIFGIFLFFLGILFGAMAIWSFSVDLTKSFILALMCPASIIISGVVMNLD